MTETSRLVRAFVAALWVAASAAPLLAQTPDEQLLAASMEGELELVQEALAAGADPNARDDGGESGLMWSAGGSYSAIVELLLSKGADPNARDEVGWTALHYAADGQASNADIDDPAYHEDFRRCVRLLLGAGADPGLENEDGDTAHDLATDEQIRSMLQESAAQG